MSSLGDHLRRKRLDLGLLQREVAALLGVTRTTVKNWEANRTKPSHEYAKKITGFLDSEPTPDERPS